MLIIYKRCIFWLEKAGKKYVPLFFFTYLTLSAPYLACLYIHKLYSDDWRKANVTPIYKKGKEELGNLQPVSLTSILGMVMEQVILEVITKHVKETKVIRIGEHVFTKGKSCMINLIAFYDDVAGWVDEERAADITYLDFSKAFDTISLYPFG